MTQFQLFAPTDDSRFMDAVASAMESDRTSDFEFGSFESDDDSREFFSFAACDTSAAQSFVARVAFFGCAGCALLTA